jgi:hypothetical protein
MKHAAPFLLPILLLAGPVARAQETADEEYLHTSILDAHVKPSACNLRKAVRLSFDEAFRRARESGSTCVAVEGYWTGTALAGDRDTVRAADAPPGRRIGLYGRKHVRSFAPGARVRAIGYLGDCATQWPPTVNVDGYCHYTREGPILILAQVVRR